MPCSAIIGEPSACQLPRATCGPLFRHLQATDLYIFPAVSTCRATRSATCHLVPLALRPATQIHLPRPAICYLPPVPSAFTCLATCPLRPHAQPRASCHLPSGSTCPPATSPLAMPPATCHPRTFTCFANCLLPPASTFRAIRQTLLPCHLPAPSCHQERTSGFRCLATCHLVHATCHLPPAT